jgi:subtilisin family serine protease
MKRFALLTLAVTAVVASSGAAHGTPPLATTEVVVTLKAPPLAAFGRSLESARHETYGRELAAAQAQASRNVVAAIPSAKVTWHYRLVADGFAVVVPKGDVPLLKRIAGVAQVWPNVTYHALQTGSAEAIGADRLWGTTLANAGQGMKIGIIDDGIDQNHPFFNPAGFKYPPGFPKGQVAYTTAKVIVARAFPRPGATWKYAGVPFDPEQSFHGTHVAGIAAGDHGVADGDLSLSGIAPDAYLGNYKVLTTPTTEFGLDGNSAEIAAAIEAAVSDGMNVINLSLGEPEVEPSRDIVVHAIDAAAEAGVVPVVAAGNDFTDYGYGSISSPANAPDALAVAATTTTDTIASFSSGGPTPVSLLMKPDISAPGVDITSSLPPSQGAEWGSLEGTSMASPQVAGSAALLLQLHKTWTVAQVRSALVQTADPVMGTDGREVLTTREGGGFVDLGRATDPLIFSAPTSISFPVDGGTSALDLTDAGGGAGAWSVAVTPQQTGSGITFSAPTTVTVPGPLAVTAHPAATTPAGDYTGFVVLTQGTNTRRLPFWVEVSHPVLGTEHAAALSKPGTYTSTTVGGATKVSAYRYPTGGPTYPGPEVVYQVKIATDVANFGVAVLSGKAVPHVVFAGDEDHLVGYTGLPQAINPYLNNYGDARPIAGAVLPLPGTYDIVFDTRSAAQAGPFTFRYWVNDTTPPVLRLLTGAPAGTIWVSAVDAGAGVDPTTATATIDGQTVPVRYGAGKLVIRAKPGTHKLVVSVSDYQESKNMEDVAPVTPNTATAAATVHVS